jgi:predicted acyl esterase
VLVALTLASTAAAAGLSAHGSAEQVYATGVKGRVTLIDRSGKVVATRKATAQGGVVFRNVKPGSGYKVRQGGKLSGALKVFSDSPKPPSTKGYSQKIPSKGYGYLTTRDGTKLAIYVQVPAGNGPFPTLVEYSGYGYANPNGPETSISQIATLLGFAVVDVNMRGTGCSGGSFDYFEPLQALDGYDVIETVARQPWVLHHKVGMMGVSYGGISQLFVGATNPPSLAGITPLSVIDNTATTLYPGGILNTGFALTWAEERVHDAKPASSTGGQKWALDRIKAGDKTCKANQALHGDAVNLIKKIHANRYYVPAVADPVSPVTFVHKIKAPVYLACQWTDEQTGGHCPALASQFTGTKRKWFTFTNGTHIDSLDAATFNRWYDFLKLYVARQVPTLSPALKSLAPTIFQTAMGVPNVNLPDDPTQSQPSYSAALAAFQALPQVRILFDNGAGGAPGAPLPGFEQSFPRFPLPGTQARSWYLGASGALTDAKPTAAGTDVFTWNKSARPAKSFSGNTASGPGGLWTATPQYNWAQNPPGTALSSNAAVIGAGALQAWIKSSAKDVDLQVTVSEVRPDGKETFVQNGWLRASGRKLDPKKSTLLEPQPSFTRADVAPLPKGKFSEIDVPLYYEGHVYRAGSRIRVTIAAPGGDQPVWGFSSTVPRGTATVSLIHSPAMRSRLILPVVPGVTVPTPLPPCPGLRGEACRTYQAYTNQSS